MAPGMAPQTPQSSGPPTPTHEPQLPGTEGAKTHLAARRLRAGENLAELAADLLRLTKLAYPHMDAASQDELARDRLLVEVDDPQARKRARLTKPPTMAAALRALTGFTPASFKDSTPADSVQDADTGPARCCACNTDLVEATRENTAAMRRLMDKLVKVLEEKPEPGVWSLWRLLGLG